MKDRLPRKLAAILYADVVDYSRLTGEDEEGTHRTLRTYLDLISSSIRDHSGRAWSTMRGMRYWLISEPSSMR